MSIVEDVVELSRLNDEIKRQQKELRVLRKHKEECEKRVLDYLDANEQPGIKFRGMTIIAEERRKRRYRKKKEKIEQGESVLQRYGVSNSREALDELMESMRGSPEPKTKLRIL